FKFDNTQKTINKFKQHIKNHNCPVVTLDFSGLDIFEAVKAIVLSSAYHYGRYPQGKVRCCVPSDDVRNLVSNFSVRNLEFI
ncbi:MAG: hypothetical protein LBJ74_00520, partial [Heliobacteriaceae bacterium]|nr:hypothetical protein [Heliobacteriaceae bacterium]